jgi:hypothetical protein
MGLACEKPQQKKSEYSTKVFRLVRVRLRVS